MEGILSFISVVSIVCMVAALPLVVWHVGIGAMGLVRTKKPRKLENKLHRFAVITCARNEEAVIDGLLDSLRQQEYPPECYDIFVVADNCTDDTAEVARRHGAKVFERFNKSQVGKGFALHWAFDRLWQNYPGRYDAVAIFDADNLVAPDFLTKTNDALCSGADVIQGYRDSKNPRDSWVSGCYSLYWIGLMRFFHCARSNWGLPCQIGGTGFAFKMSAIQPAGWNTRTLVEDGEFSVQQILAGHKVVPVPDAVFYDEQPSTFSMSLRQRYRWVVGGMQCFRLYFRDALRSFRLKGSWGALDAALYLILLPVLAILTVTGAAGSLALLLHPDTWQAAAIFVTASGVAGYLAMAGLALLVVLLEKRSLREYWKAVLLFPLFMLPMAYLALVAMFRPTTEWKPIVHTKTSRISDMEQNTEKAI